MSREPERTRSRTVASPVQQYVERTVESRDRYEEATEYLPGGNTRGVLYYPPYPAYIESADGAVVTDVDGNEYLDFLNNYTSLIHGHTPAPSIEAAGDAIRSGPAPGGPTPVEIDWAKHLVDRAPAVESVRFTNSGTEATMNAIRAARAYTGRDVIAKFEGGYHGTQDAVQMSVHPPGHLAGPPQRPNTVPDSSGIPASTRDEVITCPYNHADATLERLDDVTEDLAGVILCPTLGSSVITAKAGFIEALDDWTTQHDVPLIFDEVISFRVAYGGAHAEYAIDPDLVTYGKLIGGGFPVGAFGGREEVMAPYDPRGGSDIVHSGTFNANPVTASAGLATLEAYDSEAVTRLNDLAGTLVTGVRDVTIDRGLDLQINQSGSLFNVYLSPTPIEDYRGKSEPEALVHELFLTLLNDGIRLAPKLMGCLSTPMGEAAVNRFIEAFDDALGMLKPEFEARAPDLVR